MLFDKLSSRSLEKIHPFLCDCVRCKNVKNSCLSFFFLSLSVAKCFIEQKGVSKTE